MSTKGSFWMSGRVVCLEPPQNMISWWPGDENTWDYVDGNTGTLMGGATYGDGKVGKAFSLNGTSAYVQIGNPENLYITKDVTVDAWIKIQDLPEGQVASIAGKWGYRIDLDSYGLSTVKVKGQIMLASGIGDGLTADQGLLGGVIQPNEWAHVAMTYKASTGENILYINGMNVGSRTRIRGIFPTGVNFLIGAQEQNGTTPWRFFPGLIDEVEVFGRALDEWELKALYSVGSLGKCKPQIAPPPEVPEVEKIFKLTIPQGASVSPDTQFFGYFSSKKYSGNFENTSIPLLGGPPIYASQSLFVPPGKYDWEIYGIYGNPSKEFTIAAGKEEELSISPKAKINQGEWIPPGGFRTQTHGGWGTKCNGNNPGCYRDTHFDTCFLNGLVVGCNLKLTMKKSSAFPEFLHGGGTPEALTQDYVDPTDKELKNTLATQVVALKLNVEFDICDASFGSSTTNLKDLVVADPDSVCYGMTVQQVLGESNKVLGGCISSFTASQISDCATKINENFVDGTTVGTFLRLP